MNICRICGKSFDPTSVKRQIGRRYGSGQYDSYFPDGDVCESCADEEMSPDFGTGGEIFEDMGSGWDPD